MSDTPAKPAGILSWFSSSKKPRESGPATTTNHEHVFAAASSPIAPIGRLELPGGHRHEMDNNDNKVHLNGMNHAMEWNQSNNETQDSQQPQKPRGQSRVSFGPTTTSDLLPPQRSPWQTSRLSSSSQETVFSLGVGSAGRARPTSQRYRRGKHRPNSRILNRSIVPSMPSSSRNNMDLPAASTSALATVGGRGLASGPDVETIRRNLVPTGEFLPPRSQTMQLYSMGKSQVLRAGTTLMETHSRLLENHQCKKRKAHADANTSGDGNDEDDDGDETHRKRVKFDDNTSTTENWSSGYTRSASGRITGEEINTMNLDEPYNCTLADAEDLRKGVDFSLIDTSRSLIPVFMAPKAKKRDRDEDSGLVVVLSEAELAENKRREEEGRMEEQQNIRSSELQGKTPKDDKDVDWRCPDCGHMNSGGYLCMGYKCGHKRNEIETGEVQPGWGEAFLAKYMEGWKCPGCRAQIKTAEKCQTCGIGEGEDAPSAPSTTSTVPAPPATSTAAAPAALAATGTGGLFSATDTGNSMAATGGMPDNSRVAQPSVPAFVGNSTTKPENKNSAAPASALPFSSQPLVAPSAASIDAKANDLKPGKEQGTLTPGAAAPDTSAGVPPATGGLKTQSEPQGAASSAQSGDRAPAGRKKQRSGQADGGLDQAPAPPPDIPTPQAANQSEPPAKKSNTTLFVFGDPAHNNQPSSESSSGAAPAPFGGGGSSTGAAPAPFGSGGAALFGVPTPAAAPNLATTSAASSSGEAPETAATLFGPAPPTLANEKTSSASYAAGAASGTKLTAQPNFGGSAASKCMDAGSGSLFSAGPTNAGETSKSPAPVFAKEGDKIKTPAFAQPFSQTTAVAPNGDKKPLQLPVGTTPAATLGSDAPKTPAPMFGQPGFAGTPAAGSFGQTQAAAAPAQAAAASLATFGQAQAPTAPTPGAFGQAQAPAAPGGFGQAQAPAGTFGQAQAPTAPTPGAFGQAQAPAAPGGFGQAQAPAAPTFPGAPAPAPIPFGGATPAPAPGFQNNFTFGSGVNSAPQAGFGANNQGSGAGRPTQFGASAPAPLSFGSAPAPFGGNGMGQPPAPAATFGAGVQPPGNGMGQPPSTTFGATPQNQPGGFAMGTGGTTAIRRRKIKAKRPGK